MCGLVVVVRVVEVSLLRHIIFLCVFSISLNYDLTFTNKGNILIGNSIIVQRKGGNGVCCTQHKR